MRYSRYSTAGVATGVGIEMREGSARLAGSTNFDKANESRQVQGRSERGLQDAHDAPRKTQRVRARVRRSG
jgi:hypothetical protein